MVEIPRLQNGEQHIICLTCSARTIKEEKVYCDERKLHRRPRECPLPPVPIKSNDPYTMLRKQLRSGNHDIIGK